MFLYGPAIICEQMYKGPTCLPTERKKIKKLLHDLPC